MTTYRSRKDGSHYPLSKRRTTRSYQTGVAHLGVPRRFGQKTVQLKSFGQYGDDVYYKGKHIGSIRKISSDEYLVAKNNPSEEFNPQTHVFKTQQEAINALTKNTRSILVNECGNPLSPQAVEGFRLLEKEKAMVKDEAEGHSKYLKMAETAEKEGRHEDAKVFRQHSQDELRHKHEDQKIVERTTERKYPDYSSPKSINERNGIKDNRLPAGMHSKAEWDKMGSEATPRQRRFAKMLTIRNREGLSWKKLEAMSEEELNYRVKKLGYVE